MKLTTVELTTSEQKLLEQIDFGPDSPGHGYEYWTAVGAASDQLMQSLLARKAIPEVRWRWFTEPKLNMSRIQTSRFGIFERNGTKGRDVFRHAHFLPYLHYFLYGPDLPASVLKAFGKAVDDCGMITSGDIIPLGRSAKQLVRQYNLDPQEASEAFFQLALEQGLDAYDARSIRDAVRSVRPR